MWTKLMKGSFILGLFLLAVQSFAATELTIEKLRKEVLDENLDIRVQYEKYYQAQRNVGVALGQFLPNANINLININAYLAVLQSVVPTPSHWFDYQASQELREAEKYTTKSIKLNILEGLTVNYVNLKHQETVLQSMKKQEQFLRQVCEDIKKKEELGLAEPNDVFIARRNLLQHRQDIFALETLMSTVKQALLIALNRTPDEELILGALPDENLGVIPSTVDEGIELALKNSAELVSNKYQAQAAGFMVASKKWSFISFNGIGFDYASSLAIERSRAKVIELQREQITLKIKNQVFAAYDDLSVLDQRIDIQEQVVASNEAMDARNTELYENQLIPISRYLESKNSLVGEERGLVRLKMQRLAKLAHLKRLLGLDASLTAVASTSTVRTDSASYEAPVSKELANAIELIVEEKRVNTGTEVWFELWAPSDVLDMIHSVSYRVNGSFYGASEDRTLLFSVLNNFSSLGHYELEARIRFKDGKLLVKTQSFDIE